MGLSSRSQQLAISHNFCMHSFSSFRCISWGHFNVHLKQTVRGCPKILFRLKSSKKRCKNNIGKPWLVAWPWNRLKQIEIVLIRPCENFGNKIFPKILTFSSFFSFTDCVLKLHIRSDFFSLLHSLFQKNWKNLHKSEVWSNSVIFVPLMKRSWKLDLTRKIHLLFN